MKSVNNGKANAGRDLNLVLASDDHGLFQMLANALSRCHAVLKRVQHHHHPACCIRLSRLRIVQGQVLHETAPIVQASERMPSSASGGKSSPSNSVDCALANTMQPSASRMMTPPG